MNPNIEAFLNNTAARLESAGIENPRQDVKILLAHVLGIEPGEVPFYPHDLSMDRLHEFETLLDERLQRKPIDKILGSRGFYKYDFIVNGAVLSPRPETEILVEAAAECIEMHQIGNILDLGVGSGCILLSLLADFPALKGCGIDISAEALEVAGQNALKLKVNDRARLLTGSWFEENLSERLGQKFDVIVSNPPYIPTGDISGLQAEVKEYDPLIALDGGDDGLKDYCRIAELAPELLNDNGFVFLEVGIGQAAEVARIFGIRGFKLLQIIKDYGGIERCVILKK